MDKEYLVNTVLKVYDAIGETVKEGNYKFSLTCINGICTAQFIRQDRSLVQASVLAVRALI